MISRLKDANGDWCMTEEDFINIVTSYFEELSSTSHPSGLDDVLNCIQPRVTEEANDKLCKPYTHGDVDQALAQMHPHKAPRLDGMNPFFFQKFWDIVGNDVFATVLSILHGHLIPTMLIRTFVALIPKKAKPESIFEFTPISLCNVIYKLVTKVIANHLKPLLPHVISDMQGAYVQGRLMA